MSWSMNDIAVAVEAVINYVILDFVFDDVVFSWFHYCQYHHSRMSLIGDFIVNMLLFFDVVNATDAVCHCGNADGHDRCSWHLIHTDADWINHYRNSFVGGFVNVPKFIILVCYSQCVYSRWSYLIDTKLPSLIVWFCFAVLIIQIMQCSFVIQIKLSNTNRTVQGGMPLLKIVGSNFVVFF